MRKMWVRSLGWEDCPGVGNGNPLQYSCLGSPGKKEPEGLQSCKESGTPSDRTRMLHAVARGEGVPWTPDHPVSLMLHQFSSVTQSCPTLCNPMNRSTPGLPVHHRLPESTQTHVHRVSDAIQPSHPLSSPSPPALSLSQHQGLFKRSFTIKEF